jgi:hypothetical protein
MSKKKRNQASRQVVSLAAKTVEFNPDYSIIKRDLKHIGVLVGVFFAILILLAIFQNQLIALVVK